MKPKKINASRSPETGDYIPTPEEMGYSFEETLKFSPEQWDGMVRDFNNTRIDKQKAKKMEKIENEQILNATHWYNSMPHDKIFSAVAKTIKYYDQLCQEYTCNMSSGKLKYYYEVSLAHRVKESNLKLPPVSYKKLKKFPHFNKEENCLYGNKYQMMEMYIALFPSFSKRSGKVKFV